MIDNSSINNSTLSLHIADYEALIKTTVDDNGHELILQKHDSLEKAGVKVRKNLTVEDIYQEIAETDTENWENIRGPREFEDNQQYEEAKKRQKAEAEIKRKALKAKLKEEEALLQQHLQQKQ
uniref:Cytochrome c oxidase assembly protein COX16 homolog, mitochondrial n=1 Tax=Panagrolaimus sp. ES5 TaxID=591445 RepID=A0AC34FGW2_9BILA